MHHAFGVIFMNPTKQLRRHFDLALIKDVQGERNSRRLRGKTAFTFVPFAFFWESSQPHLGHTAGLCLFLYM